jgi:hypothetical protein
MIPRRAQIDAIVLKANVLDHSDADHAVEPAVDFAIVAELNPDIKVAEPGRGKLLLFTRNR